MKILPGFTAVNVKLQQVPAFNVISSRVDKKV